MTQPSAPDSEKLRQAMRAWASGVTIVTSVHEGVQHGMTVSSFTSIAIEPPIILVSLQTGSRTHELVLKSNLFAVTILAEDQQEISERFAGRVPDTEDRFTDMETETLVSGASFIKGGLAYMDCRVTRTILVGSNTLFLAEVIATKGNGKGVPLVYHNRNYQKLD